MRTFALSLAALCCGSTMAAAPTRLTTFADLMKALRSGETVNLVLDYGKMKLIIGNEEVEAPKAIGGMKFTPWEFFEKGVIRNERAYVVGSDTHMISHPRYGYVDNYVRVRIYEDQAVEINARYITLDKRETVMDETFTTKLSNGKDAYGASAFIAR